MAKRKKAVKRSSGEKNSRIKLRIRIPQQEKIVKFIDSAIFVLICAMVLVVPLVFTARYYYSFEFPKFVAFISFTILVTTLFIIRTVLTQGKNLVQYGILTTAMIFLISYIVSTILSPSPITSITGIHGIWSMGLISMICFVLMIIISANSIKKENHQSILFWIITIAAVISSLLGLITKFILNDTTLSFDGRISATQGHPIHLGMMLTLTIPATLSLISFHKEKLIRGLILALAMIQATTIITTFSRAAWLVLAIIALIYTVPLYKKFSVSSKNAARNKLIFIVSTAIGGAIILIAFPQLWERISQIWTQPKEINSFAIRFSEWKSTWKIFLNNPITGTGPEMLPSEFPQHRELWMNETEDWLYQTAYCRNTYLNLLATTGLIGFIPFIIFAWTSIKSSTQKILTGLKSGNHFDIFDPKYSIGVGVLVWFLNCIHYYPTVTTLTLGAILLGIFTSFHSNKTSPKRQSGIPSKFIVLVTILLFFIASISIFNFEQAEAKFNKSLSQTTGEAISTINSAIQHNPNEPIYHRQKAYYLVTFLQIDTDRSNKDNLIMQTKTSYSAAISLNPYDLNNYDIAANSLYNLDILYPDRGYDQQAIAFGHKALELAPNNPAINDALGLYYLEAENYDAAFEYFDKSTSLKNDYWAAYLHKAEIYIQKGNTERATELLNKVVLQSSSRDQVNTAYKRLGEINRL